MKWMGTDHGRGTTYGSLGLRDGWQVSCPAQAPERPYVELRYGRRTRPNCLQPAHFDIGRFSSAGEAMLAARMFEDGGPGRDSAAFLGELGFQPYYPGAHRLEIRNGGLRAGSFVFLEGVGQNNLETGLVYSAPRARQQDNVARIWAASVNLDEAKPINSPDIHGVQMAIVAELLGIRMARGPDPRAMRVPMDIADYQAWEIGRYGATPDPDADRPYVLASLEVRNRAAGELLLEDEDLRGRLGIAPGYTTRVRDGHEDKAHLLEALLMASTPPVPRAPVMDMLDRRTVQIQADLQPRVPSL